MKLFQETSKWNHVTDIQSRYEPKLGRHQLYLTENNGKKFFCWCKIIIVDKTNNKLIFIKCNYNTGKP